MEEIISFLIVGVIIIFLGIMNIRGNLSLLHSYHKKRVSEEDKIPFGKTIGLGTVLCGAGVFSDGIFMLIKKFTDYQLFSLIGTIVLSVGLIVGLAVCLYALFKYNKGIF